MVCPSCGTRRAKRACPALNAQICPVCCGTKRLVEINCPETCQYLTTARAHPPAVVQRQQERDRDELLPVLAGLSERQARLLLLYAAVVARHKPEAFHKLLDEDVAQAAAAHAATLETSSRGIVYEHRPSTTAAERLLSEFRALAADLAREGGSAIERDSSIALRRLEAAAREFAQRQSGSIAFQGLLGRMLQPESGAPRAEASKPQPSSLILPP